MARNELIAAEHALEAATDALIRVLPTAGSLRDEYVDALTRHENADRAMVPAEILDRWGHYPAWVDQLEYLLDALDTWKRWALGHDVSGDHLTDSAAVINRVAANWRGPRLAEIAATVDEWLRQAGLTLSPETPGHRPSTPVLRRDLGLEL